MLTVSCATDDDTSKNLRVRGRQKRKSRCFRNNVGLQSGGEKVTCLALSSSLLPLLFTLYSLPILNLLSETTAHGMPDHSICL